jgi:3-carboxy-cis,cis-muconate cycloisomerase
MPVPDWGLLDPLSSPNSAATDDAAILTALVQTESALTLAWLDIGLAPDWVSTIDLARVHLSHDVIAAGTRSGGNPVIPLVSQLRSHVDAIREGAGDWVHRGATSQDILDTALMLVASRAIDVASGFLTRAASDLAALVEKHRHTPMVGRTLTQHAAPITFGAKAATWLEGVLAAEAAITAATTPVQLAGAVGTGASFADLTGDPAAGARLRAAFAARLGLADAGRSWQAERSPVVSVASALALAIGALGRIATDVLVLARTDVGELSEASSGTSSAMPQKQNPTTAVLIRSAALQAPGLLATVHSALLVEDERPAGAWHSEWPALRSLLRLAIEAAEATSTLVKSLVVDTERMAANLDASFGLAWSEHAQSLLTRELGRAAAFAFVARAVAATSNELSFGAALAAELDGRVIDLSPESIYPATDAVIDAALARFGGTTK